MRKFRKITSKVVAFAMAAAMTCTGAFDNLSLGSKGITGNLSGLTDASAATTGTINADRFTWDNASVYFLLTDRFKNGNTENDHSYNRGLDQNGNVVQGVDDRATFHGGDFAGITQTIEDGYFNDLGVNALWISAPYEQIHGYLVGGNTTPSFAHYSYHGYYVLDYTDTDANFGTETEFQKLVDTAHEHGLRIVMDIVLNHAGYNSLYDMNEFGFGSLKSGWDSYYYSMQNVNNADYHSNIDYESSAADWASWWGPSWVRAGLPGYTEGGGDNYTSSLLGLPDFKTESTSEVGIPTFLANKWKSEGRYDKEVKELKDYLNANGYKMTVTNCISYWLSSWVREYGVDGFRCDTAKHVELSSWKTLKTMCTEALKTWKANNPNKKLDDLDFWMTGECWDHTLSYDGYYTQGGFDSMINFNTNGAGVLASGSLATTYKGYAEALNVNPNYNVLSFISSHDESLARGDMIYIGSAFLLLPGAVQIYYGDETNRKLVDGIPFDGNGGAGHSLRSDMNWDSIDETELAHWQKVGSFRNSHVAVGAGENASITASSGNAFTRTYASGDVKDRVAFCIGATANTNVTMDVSSVWNDGDTVVNYYDSSSAVVTDGKVTFNSGANSTILLQDPDGKPLVSFIGDATFTTDTQVVTASIKDTEQAIVSVDGAKKIIVKDGDKLTIGATAYYGDTIKIAYTASNDKGTVNGAATFLKKKASGGGGEVVEEKNIVHVKMADGSVPNIYAWTGASTNLTGAWPGSPMTQKDSDGYYYLEFDEGITYNVILNNGSAKTDDITGLKGEVWIDVAAGYGSYTKRGGTEEVIDNTITIHVKPYSTTAPVMYVWNGSKTYNGGFPGKQLTNKDEDGWYTFVLEGVESVSCIVGDGTSSNKTGDITGITGEAWITITSEDNTKYKVEKAAVVESKMESLRKETRGIKNLTASDYTQSSYKALYALVADSDKLIALEDEADDALVSAMYDKIMEAKGKLVLAKPSVTSATVGGKTVTGKAAYGATVEVKVAGNTYSVVADEITGVYCVTVSTALKSTDVLAITASRDGLSGETYSYDMSGSHVVPVDELSVSLALSASTIEAKQSVTMTASANGGKEGYTYKYEVANSSLTSFVTIKTTTDVQCVWKSSTAGSRYLVVTVTDAAGNVATDKKLLTITAPQTDMTAAMTLSNSTIAPKSSVAMNVAVTGGNGKLSYKYQVANEALTSFVTIATGTSNACTWKSSVAGKRYLVVTVTDAAGNVATDKKLLTIKSDSDLNAELILNSSTITPGSAVTMTASATGGSDSYKYSFKVWDETMTKQVQIKATSSSNTCTWKSSTAGRRYLEVTVADTEGNIATAKQLITIENINIGGDKKTVSLSLDKNTINAKDSVKMTALVTGASGNYKYKYEVANSSLTAYVTIGSGTSNTCTWKSSTAGTRYLVVTVIDETGVVMTAKQLLIIE